MFGNYTGYNTNCITIQRSMDSPVEKGDMVNIDALAGTLKVAGKDEAFIGVAVDVREYNVTVQTQGYVELKMDNNSGITYGPQKLVAGTSGIAKDKTENSANYVRTVVAFDLDSKTVGVIL